MSVNQQVTCFPSDCAARSNPQQPHLHTHTHDTASHCWGRAMRFALAVLIGLIYYLSLLNSRRPVHGWSNMFPDPADLRISRANRYKNLWRILIPLIWGGVWVFLTIILKAFLLFCFPPLLPSWFVYFTCSWFMGMCRRINYLQTHTCY